MADARGNSTHAPGGADLLAVGFGMAVAMWALGYVGRLPGVSAPGPLLAAGFLAILVAGGNLIGRTTHRGALGGALAGALTAALNLLVVLSLVRSDTTPHAPFSLASIPATVLGTALVTAAAAAWGARAPSPTTPNWTGRLAVVAAAATLLLIGAGGLVTGREAGLSVPDWPASFGSNMFLYPLARMTGNIYYEHTHRLYGALVGLTTFALAIHLWRVDSRRWLRALALAAVVGVVAQGSLGGLRVTLANAGDGVHTALAHHETTISAALRVAHGVLGQVFFGVIVLIAGATSTAWGAAKGAVVASLDRSLSLALVYALVGQLLLGALLRHLAVDAIYHIAAAGVVTLVALFAGTRAWALHRSPPLRASGVAVLLLVTFQVLLGVGAWVAVSLSPPHDPTTFDALITTAHQTNGAALLAGAVLVAAFTHLPHAVPAHAPAATA